MTPATEHLCQYCHKPLTQMEWQLLVEADAPNPPGEVMCDACAEGRTPDGE